MTSLREVLDSQRRPVEVVDPNGTVLEAIARMAREHIGCLVVTGDSHVLGVFSERDYLQRVVLRGRSSRTTLVREVMTSPALVADVHDEPNDCLRRLLSHRVKYLPVTEHDLMVGLLSRGDLTRHFVRAADGHARSASGRYVIPAFDEETTELKTG